LSTISKGDKKVASILDIVKGLSQAASNAYDGYQHMDDKIGLRREEGNPIVDSRIMDGFAVRFAADKLIITYQSDILVKELHPRTEFENEIERRFADIVKFLKKEYKNVTGNSVSLSPTGPADMMVQSTSRVRNWVQAVKQYSIGGDSTVDSLGKTSDERREDGIKKFMDLASNKRPPNDTRKKN
tara:strand:+ start:619 stop:1173 length:555 start_codon:yes stop_codon:yes gene_type:complete